jgi:hypothetical protein
VDFRICAWSKQRPGQKWAIINVTASVAFPKLWAFIQRCDVFADTSMHTATGCGGLFPVIFPREVYPSWSRIDEQSDPEMLGREMVDQFEKYIFPFLKHYSFLDNAMAYWEPKRHFEGMARIAALVMRGERSKAITELDERIAEAMANAAESQRPGDSERAAELMRLKEYVSSLPSSLGMS